MIVDGRDRGREKIMGCLNNLRKSADGIEGLGTGCMMHDAGWTMDDGRCRSKIPFLSGVTGYALLEPVGFSIDNQQSTINNPKALNL